MNSMNTHGEFYCSYYSGFEFALILSLHIVISFTLNAQRNIEKDIYCSSLLGANTAN